MDLKKVDSVSGDVINGAVFELHQGSEKLYFDAGMHILMSAQVLEQIGETDITSEAAAAKMAEKGITSSFTMGEISIKGLAMTGYTYADGEFTEDTPTVYELVEISAPAGYLITGNHNYFKVAGIRDASQTTRVRYTGIAIRLTDADGKDLVEDDGTTPKLVNQNATVTGSSMEITLSNESGAALPNTGGPGTTIFYLIGLMLFSLAGAGLVMRRKRKAV